MPRYKLRTLLILMAVLPPLLWLGWTKYTVWREEQQRRAELVKLQAVDGMWVVDIQEWYRLVDGQVIPVAEPNP
jgi:hypothetical protein